MRLDMQKMQCFKIAKLKQKWYIDFLYNKTIPNKYEIQSGPIILLYEYFSAAF